MQINDSANDVKNQVQGMYANMPEGTRANFNTNKDKALTYYQDFVSFVSKVAPVAQYGTKEACLLDVGCGCGWSSYALVQAGYQTTGIDLNATAFEPPPTEGLKFLEASAINLPFPDRSFDVIVSYQCLEHVPVPETALSEMVRICRPGGVVCIVGPNLVSPFLPIKYLISAMARRERFLWKRGAMTPRHPYGNTVLEMVVSVPIKLLSLIKKLFTPEPHFTMREPDALPPFVADNDACYLCNPTDLIKFFPRHNCQVIQVGKHGRLPLSYLIAGGTWVAARKRD